MIGHGIDVCACGAVVAQCRCIDCGAKRRVVAQSCSSCRDAKKPRHEPTPTKSKIVISVKDPDGVYESCEQAIRQRLQALEAAGIDLDEYIAESVRAQVHKATAPWVKWGEYLEIEIDVDAGTAEVRRIG